MKALTILFLVFSGCAALAQQTDTVPDDTPKEYALKEVVVFGTPLPRYAPGSRITVLDSSVLSQYNSAALSDVLQNQMPLYFRNYGQNQLSSVGFRGTSANHTAVLWNGFALNSPTFGSSDFSALPAFGFDQVEIQHGGSAATWGSGAIGGSVLLSSRPVFGGGWQLSAQTETSRFGTGDFSLSPLKASYLSNQVRIRYGHKNLHFSTNAWQRHAENDFPYRNTTAFGTPQVRQPNAAFRQWGVTQDADWKFARRGLLSAKIWHTHTYRQAQPSMLEANQGNYRVDGSFRAMLSGSYHTRLGETTLKTAFFRDALDWNGANSPVRSTQAQLLHEKVFSPKLSVKAGAEVQFFRADIAGNYRRRETRQSVFMLSAFRPWERLTLTLNVRQAWVTGFDPPFTPHLGANANLYKSGKQELDVKANVGRGYRVPTLHDRFWIPGGNPAIRPETSLGYEAGVAHRMSLKNWQLASEATYYRNAVRDWIQWVPSGGQGIWSPQNAVSVRTQGMELSGQATHTRKHTRISLKVQYFLNRAVDRQPEKPEETGRQLPFTPLHNLMVFAQVRHKDWFGFANYAFTGPRETFGYDERMEPYGLSDAVVGRTIRFRQTRLQFLFKCDNLLNARYQTYGHYAMPGRSYSVGIRWQAG